MPQLKHKQIPDKILPLLSLLVALQHMLNV
jgi:hypothetical protein